MNEVTKKTFKSAKAGAPVIFGMAATFLVLAVAGQSAANGELASTSEILEGIAATLIYVLPSYIGLIALAHAILTHTDGVEE